MTEDRSNFLSREDVCRPNESALFAQVARDLEQRTQLTILEARGTLSLALKLAGVLTRDVGADELRRGLEESMPGELKARGIQDASTICAEIAIALPTD